MSAMFNVNSRPETELEPLGRIAAGFSLAGRIELSGLLSGFGGGWWVRNPIWPGRQSWKGAMFENGHDPAL